MSASVTIQEMDLVVLGQVQYAFKLEGKGEGLSLSEVLAPCCAQRAVAIEGEMSLVSEQLRVRTRKVSDLGVALSDVAYIMGAFAEAKAREKQSGEVTELSEFPGNKYIPDEMKKGTLITELWNKLSPYALTYQDKDGKTKSLNDLLWSAKSKGQITKNDTEIAQSAVKLGMDKENNAIRQGSNTLMSFVKKRDSAYQLIGKITKKINSTAGTTISAIGR